MGKYIIFSDVRGVCKYLDNTQLLIFWLYYMKQFNFRHFSTNRFPKTTEDFRRFPKTAEDFRREIRKRSTSFSSLYMWKIYFYSVQIRFFYVKPSKQITVHYPETENIKKLANLTVIKQ